MLPVTDALDSTPFTNLESFPDVEFYAAMNRVPIVFKDNKNVIESYDYLHRCSLINDAKERSRKMEDALVTFMKELCKAINIDCENWNDSKILNIFGA